MARPVYCRIQSAKGVYPDPHIKRRTQGRKRVWADIERSTYKMFYMPEEERGDKHAQVAL